MENTPTGLADDLPRVLATYKKCPKPRSVNYFVQQLNFDPDSIKSNQGCFRSVGSVPEGVRYSRYSMGILRCEAPHNSRVGGLGRKGGRHPPQEIQGGVWGGRSLLQ